MKRIIAVFFILMLSFSVYASAIDNNGNDVLDSELLELLSAQPDESNTETINRSQAAMLYCVARGIEKQEKAETLFPDTQQDENKFYINTAFQNGWMHSADEKSFEPDKTITMYEFLEGFVIVLGYGPVAETEGYVTFMHDLKLLNDTKGGVQAPLTRYNAAVIVKNALEAPVLIQEISGNKTKYVKDKKRTLLTEVHDLDIIEGYVNAIDITSLYSKDGLGNNNIKIGEQVYSASVNGEGYLGRYVKAYIDDDTVKAISVLQKRNNEFLIELDSDTYIECKTADIEIEKGAKKQKKKLSPSASFIYNGVFDVDFKMNDLEKIKNGNILLLDNDKDNTFDVVFVNEYINYYVSGVSEDRIFDKYLKDPIYFTSSDIKYLSLIKNGEEIKDPDIISSIKQGDIVSVFKSKDNKSLKLYVADKSIFDYIQSKQVINDCEVYQIGGALYDSAISGTVDQVLAAGEWGKFFFDAFGKIAAIDLKSAIETYGILTKVIEQEDSESNADIQIITKAGKFEVYATANKIELNGKKVTARDFVGMVDNSPQLVTYKLNDSGQVAELKTVAEGGITHNATEKRARWRNSSRTFASKYSVDEKTVIFSLPEQLEDCDIHDDISVAFQDQFVDNRMYSISVFDIDENRVASVIFIHNLSDTFGNEVYFVKKTTDVVNGDGEIINAIHCDGSYDQENVMFTDASVHGKIKPGTGIRIKTDKKGFIKDADVVFNGDMTEITDKYISGDSSLGVGAECVIAQGRIKSQTTGRFTLENTPYVYVYDAGSVYCAAYSDQKRDVFSKIDPFELRIGDLVFVVKSNDKVVSIIKMQ